MSAWPSCACDDHPMTHYSGEGFRCVRCGTTARCDDPCCPPRPRANLRPTIGELTELVVLLFTDRPRFADPMFRDFVRKERHGLRLVVASHVRALRLLRAAARGER